jgi:hypothetical protein
MEKMRQMCSKKLEKAVIPHRETVFVDENSGSMFHPLHHPLHSPIDSTKK